jgi:hypothetical protein
MWWQELREADVHRGDRRRRACRKSQQGLTGGCSTLLRCIRPSNHSSTIVDLGEAKEPSPLRRANWVENSIQAGNLAPSVLKDRERKASHDWCQSRGWFYFFIFFYFFLKDGVNTSVQLHFQACPWPGRCRCTRCMHTYTSWTRHKGVGRWFKQSPNRRIIALEQLSEMMQPFDGVDGC